MPIQPFPINDFLASLVEVLKVRGDARSIAVLVEGEPRFHYVGEDWGTDKWALAIPVPIHVFHAMTSEEAEQTSDSITEAARPFFMSVDDILTHVSITPMVVKADGDWRPEAKKFLSGEGLTNQGRVRSDNIAGKQHEGLLFRSRAEITFFEALKRAKLAFAPLPVFIRKVNRYNRLEPDFVIVHRGLTFVVEIDGDTVHRENPAEADRRLLPLTHEGVEVRRLLASEVETDAKADEAVRGLIAWMDQRKGAR